MMANFFNFISAVLSSWFTYVGAVVLVAGVISHLTNKRFLPNVWIAVGVICLFVACYQAWSDQRASYMAERCRIEKFEERSTAKRQLASFMNEASQLFGSLKISSSPDDVKAWFSHVDDWYNRAYIWTKDNLGEAAATKASDTMNMQTGAWSNQISPEHNQKLSTINKIKLNLGELMESSAWDDFDVRVAKSIHACNAAH
jgi:hypothetical protein